ncbi:MAG TPA: hypothetical protein VFE06_08545 [Acidobacteriaceae bacterium]|jgi:hypothetical protein|nr:hypothetical protein [Acidobacteriaceae bacterium]
MLKLIEIGLLAVTLLIVLGLVVKGRPEAAPTSDHAIGAKEPHDGEGQPKAS